MALDGLITARQTESYPICGMDEVTLEYLIAVLAMEFEKYDISSRLIYNILNTPTVNNRIKDKAREVKDELLQQMVRNNDKRDRIPVNDMRSYFII